MYSSKAIQIAAIFISLAALLLVLIFGKTIITPMVIAILFAILLRPMVQFFSVKLKMPDVLATLLTVLILVVVALSIILFISWQVSLIIADWAEIKSNVSAIYQALQQWISDTFNIAFAQQHTYIDIATDKAMNSDTANIGSTISSISGFTVNLLLFPVYTFLILYYRKMFVKALYKMIDAQNHSTLADILFQIKVVVQSYIVGLMIQMLVVGGLTAGGLMLLGVEYAIFLGVLTALLNLIPYIGIMMATSVTLMATLISPSHPLILLWVLLLAICVQLIDNNVLVPRIVGNKVRLNALVSIIGVVVGGSIAGISGMFLAIPSLAIIKVIFDRIESLAPYGYVMGSDINEKGNWMNLRINRPKKS